MRQAPRSEPGAVWRRPNGITTNTTGDPFGRPAKIVTTDTTSATHVARTTNVTYVDMPAAPSNASDSDLNTGGDQALTATKTYDQLGRVKTTASSAPGGTIDGQTIYSDGAFTLASSPPLTVSSSTLSTRVVSNPYQGTITGWTCTQLDQL